MNTNIASRRHREHHHGSMNTNYWLFVLTESDPLILILSAGQHQFEKQRDLVARCADAPVDAGRLKGLVGDLPRAQHGIEVDKDFVGEHCEGHVAPLCQTVAEGTGQHHRIGLQRSKVQVLGWKLWQRDKRKIQLVVSQLGEEAHRKRHCHRRHDLGVLGGEPGDEGRQVQACERGNGPNL